MLSDLLNRKSASRSAQVPFHVVSLIPRAGFQKRFIVSVLQSYAPFNVSVFKRWGERASVKTCVLYTSQLRDHAAQGGEPAIWPPGSQHGAWMDGWDDIHWPLSQAHAYLCLVLTMVGGARIPTPFPSGASFGQEDAGFHSHTWVLPTDMLGGYSLSVSPHRHDLSRNSQEMARLICQL